MAAGLTSTPLTLQARRTFQESFDSFERTVEGFSRTDARDFNDTTLRDVRDAAKQIERQLAARQCLRNMKRLEPLLNGLETYSKVIEVLCNGTFSVSWIWAPIKLMMKLATDHISAFEKLVTAYGQIAAMLPRFDLLSNALRDKPDFQQALAVVYSDILEFHKHAYKFFRRNGWVCFFKSSWGQFEGRFNYILDSLERHARVVDQDANAYLISETMQWRLEALQHVAKTEKDRSTTQLTAALAWLGLDAVPHCGQAYQDNILNRLIHDCCGGTTDWILKHQRMRAWLQNGRGPPLLWLKGKPGSGKSTLCAKITQFLRAPKQCIVLFCFYSYTISSVYPDPVVFMLATLVSQILRQNTNLATYVYEEFVAEARSVSVRDLQELISNLIPQLEMPRILIDGIDECIRYDANGKPYDLTPVKDVLTAILQLESPQQSSVSPKILVVSRDVLQMVGKLAKKPTVALDQEKEALTADILHFTKQRLNEIRDKFESLVGIDDILHGVESNIVEKSQGMFLWVRLVLAQLEVDAYNRDDLEAAIANMPRDLYDFYDRIVARITLLPQLSRERAMSILNWMICSRRLLRISELQDMIVFAGGQVSLTERSKLPASIIDLCKPLVQTDDNDQISFVHFTVQEYLVKSTFTSIRDAERCASITCMSYLTFSLNLTDPTVLDETKTVDVGKCLYSLQPYIYENWLDHLLVFTSELHGIRDCLFESCLKRFAAIMLEHQRKYPGDTEGLFIEGSQMLLTLEPRLKYIESYGNIYRLLGKYVEYRHKKKLSFQGIDANNIPPDPTPFSIAQLEYSKRVQLLLSVASFPGLSYEQINMFKAINSPCAFVCRFPGCADITAGFRTYEARERHEKTHAPPLMCTYSGCKYKLNFSSLYNLKRHIRDFHEVALKPIPRSIRPSARRIAHPENHSARGSSISKSYPQSHDPKHVKDRRPHASQFGSFELPPPGSSNQTVPRQGSSMTMDNPNFPQNSMGQGARRQNVSLQHFVQVYRSQIQKGKIPHGWQQSVPPEERGQLGLQFFTRYRLLRPDTSEIEAMRASVNFETQTFLGAPSKEQYINHYKQKLMMMINARQR
ncbi:hypothetical protein GQ44DRAFT_832316 [Phaeosphaeriaceae sp. PMI808]|nr:hypothetical protein GQ44DRAFT_832316 [Phaeosphaeriaceae sp. PMI808]